MWKLKITLLSNSQAKVGITREIRKYFKLNDNENITYQKLWHAAKAVLRGNL